MAVAARRELHSSELMRDASPLPDIVTSWTVRSFAGEASRYFPYHILEVPRRHREAAADKSGGYLSCTKTIVSFNYESISGRAQEETPSEVKDLRPQTIG